MSDAPIPGPYRPGSPPPGPTRSDALPPEPPATAAAAAGAASGATASGHAGVDALIEAMANNAELPPADQIVQYEAAHRALQDILTTIDQA